MGTTGFKMVPGCSHNEYFDRLLYACKPCRLRCSNPPPRCQRYCAASVTDSARGADVVLWTCVGLCLTVSLAIFVLMFLLKKMSAELLKEKSEHAGPALQDVANLNLDSSKPGVEIVLPRGLEYTIEECTCEDCVKSKPNVDCDHFFPLPTMEEGATFLAPQKQVTTAVACQGLQVSSITTTAGCHSQSRLMATPCGSKKNCAP